LLDDLQREEKSGLNWNPANKSAGAPSKKPVESWQGAPPLHMSDNPSGK